MKPNIALFVLSAFIHISATGFSQITPTIGNTDNVAIPQTFENVAFAKNKLTPPQGRKGSALLFSEYRLGTIYSNSFGVLEKYIINYNVETEQIEIYFPSETKMLPDSYVSSFEIIDLLQQNNQYLNLSIFTQGFEPTPLLGFGEVIIKKKDILLVKKFYIAIKEPNFNPATNTGERAETIEIKEELYIIKQEKIYSFPLSKEDLNLIFSGDLLSLSEQVKLKKMSKEKGFIQALEIFGTN